MMFDYSGQYAQGSGRRPFHMPARSTLQKARSALAVLGTMTVFLTASGQTQAGQYEYERCVQSCAYSSQDRELCIQMTCSSLHGSSTPPVNRLPPIPILYGAIAVDSQTLLFGVAKGAASRADAERRALTLCRRAGGTASGCEIAAWGHNVCLALATSREADARGNTWGAAHSDDGWVSRRNATKLCRKWGGKNCQVTVSFCTG